MYYRYWEMGKKGSNEKGNKGELMGKERRDKNRTEEKNENKTYK